MFTLKREDLLRALSCAQACVETKGTIPVLAFALVEVANGKARITATDLDVTLITTVDSEGEDASFGVPVKQLAQLVNLLSGETISFAAKEATGRVQVSCGTARHLLPTVNRESYPVIENVTGQHLIMKASMLQTMLKRTVFAVSNESSRYAMQGVYLETKEGRLIATATDGYRLAHVKYPVPFLGAVGEIIPAKAVKAILKTFENDDPITLTFGEDKIQAQQAGTTIIARTVVGQFPKYEMIIPASRDHSFKLDSSVIPMIKRAELTARTGIANHSPEVFFDVSKTGVAITSRDSDKGESEDRVETECATLNGDTVRLGIASRQLLDVMAFEPEIEIGFKDNDSAFRITPSGLREYEYVYVNMPVRLD